MSQRPHARKIQDWLSFLHCLWAYVEYDLYTAFELHTSHTIAAGQEALNIFNKLIKVLLT